MTHQSENQITPELLQQIGAAFVSLIGVQHSMGHSHAASTARDYLNHGGLSDPYQLVRDAFAACTMGDNTSEEERIARFIDEYGIGRKIASAVMW